MAHFAFGGPRRQGKSLEGNFLTRTIKRTSVRLLEAGPKRKAQSDRRTKTASAALGFAAALLMHNSMNITTRQQDSRARRTTDRVEAGERASPADAALAVQAAGRTARLMWHKW